MPRDSSSAEQGREDEIERREEPPGVTVRKMLPEDRSAVLDLLSSAPRIDLDAELGKAYAEVWLAELRSSELVCFALLWNVADDVEIVDVRTHPAHRRRGIARTLLTQVLADAKRRGTRTALLEVRRGNTPALAVYRSLGFEVTRFRPAYYADGEDAAEMSASLSDSAHR